MERFANPWYRPRALRVFRDTTNLAANPDLWSSIEKALASSAWLVLMASPNAAQSQWVNREVTWWLENKSPQRLLVVLTEGEFACDDGTGHADGAAAALPPALRGVFVDEPRLVDLRWLHDVDQVDQSNPRLRECVADVAAAVREVPKDVLVGEHIRQHRRTMRLARGAVTALAVLLIAAVVAGLVAVNQRNQAQTQRDNAIFNQITAQADRLRSTDVSLSAQLDLTAYRMRQTPDLYTALITTGNATLSAPLAGHTDIVNAVVFSPDRRTLATGSVDQTVRLWNVTDPAHPTPLGQPLTGHTGAVHSVVFRPDGQALASGSADRTVRLWNVTDPGNPTSLGQPLTGHTNVVNAVAFSPDGHTLASSSVDHTARLWNIPHGVLIGHTNFVTWPTSTTGSPTSSPTPPANSTTTTPSDGQQLQRLPHQPRVADALRGFATRGLFATCLPITLEAGHSATSGEQHARVIELIDARRRLPITAEVEQLAVSELNHIWVVPRGSAV